MNGAFGSGVFLHLNRSRLIIVDAEQVDRVCRNLLSIQFLHQRKRILLLQQVYQLSDEMSRHGRVQEGTVEQDVRQMRGMKVRLVLASRIGRRQVEDDANLTSLARLLIRLDGMGTRQDRMIGDLDSALDIHHVRIMEVVQIASLDRDDWFVVR